MAAKKINIRLNKQLSCFCRRNHGTVFFMNMLRLLFLFCLSLWTCSVFAQSIPNVVKLKNESPDSFPTAAETAKLGVKQNTDYAARAIRLLTETPLIDGHNDLAWQVRKRGHGELAQVDLSQDTSKLDPPMHTDLIRLQKGRVGAQFWSVYVPASLSPPQAVQATLEQIDVVYRMIDRFPAKLGLALTAKDIVKLHQQGKIASLIGMEGGYSIGHSLAVLRQMYALGARYMTITHSKTTPWADSATDAPQHGGLNDFGEAVIREMNRLGMIIDLSHVSADTMRDVLRISEAPVLFSHSGAGGVCSHPRNVPSDVLEQVKSNGGVIMVIFLTGYLDCARSQWWANMSGEKARLKSLYPHRPKAVDEGLITWKNEHPAPKVDLMKVVEHIDYIRGRIGAEHIGLGGDFDGMGPGPIGLEDVSKYPDLIATLLERGYSEKEVKGIIGENTLRVMRGVEETARRLSHKPADERAPLHWVE